MKRLLEADLTWTGARFEAGIQIAVSEEGRIESLGSDQREGAERLSGPTLKIPMGHWLHCRVPAMPCAN